MSGVARAGWERVSEDVIRIDGEIDAESYADFKRVADGGYRKVILRSGGGFPLVALKIAEEIAGRDVDVEIDGYCFSSCANYLALAGRRLIVPCGSVIGWHGSPSMKTEDGVREEHRIKGYPAELTATYLQWLDEFRVREQSFYRRVNVRHELLVDSVRIPAREYPPQVDEGSEVSEVSFSFDPVTAEMSVMTTAAREVTVSAVMWLPTARVLEKYGVRTDAFCPNYDRGHIEAALESMGMSEVPRYIDD
jgi:hypothetical protein